MLQKIALYYLTLGLLSAVPLPLPSSHDFENLLDQLDTKSSEDKSYENVEKIFDLKNSQNIGSEIAAAFDTVDYAAAFQASDDKILIGNSADMEKQLNQHFQQNSQIEIIDPFYGSDLYHQLNNEQPVLVEDFLSSDLQHMHEDQHEEGFLANGNQNFEGQLFQDKNSINPLEDLHLSDSVDSVDAIFGQLQKSDDTRGLEVKSDCQ